MFMCAWIALRIEILGANKTSMLLVIHKRKGYIEYMSWGARVREHKLDICKWEVKLQQYSVLL